MCFSAPKMWQVASFLLHRTKTEQVVKVISRKTASPPRMAQSHSSGGTSVTSHEGTLAPPGEYDCTLLPSAHPSPQLKRHIDRFSRFCTGHCRVSLHFTIGCSFPSYKLPFPMGDLDPSNTIHWAHPSPQPKRHLIRFSCFFGPMTAECPFTLQWDIPSPSKLPLPMGMWTPCNTWLLGPTSLLNPNGIWITSAVFAGLTNATDRQTTLLGR